MVDAWLVSQCATRTLLTLVFMTYAVFHETRYLFPWWSVLAANTLSLGAMGIYLYRRHPGLRLQYQREPLGG